MMPKIEKHPDLVFAVGFVTYTSPQLQRWADRTSLITSVTIVKSFSQCEVFLAKENWLLTDLFRKAQDVSHTLTALCDAKNAVKPRA